MIDFTTWAVYTYKKEEEARMKISSRFTIALHIFVCIYAFGKEDKITSEYLAGSIGVNTVIIRRVLGQLKAKGLVNVARGTGGAEIAKPLEDITLWDVFEAVEILGPEGMFNFQDNPNPDCPAGKNIHKILDGHLHSVQVAMEERLGQITLRDVMNDTDKYIHD